jgi:hypothetical protein
LLIVSAILSSVSISAILGGVVIFVVIIVIIGYIIRVILFAILGGVVIVRVIVAAILGGFGVHSCGGVDAEPIVCSLVAVIICSLVADFDHKHVGVRVEHSVALQLCRCLFPDPCHDVTIVAVFRCDRPLGLRWLCDRCWLYWLSLSVHCCGLDVKIGAIFVCVVCGLDVTIGAVFLCSHDVTIVAVFRCDRPLGLRGLCNRCWHYWRSLLLCWLYWRSLLLCWLYWLYWRSLLLHCLRLNYRWIRGFVEILNLNTIWGMLFIPIHSWELDRIHSWDCVIVVCGL